MIRRSFATIFPHVAATLGEGIPEQASPCSVDKLGEPMLDRRDQKGPANRSHTPIASTRMASTVTTAMGRALRVSIRSSGFK